MRLPPTHSIRSRITAAATLLAAVVLVVAAIVILAVQRSQLIANLDNSLEQRADTVIAGLDAGESVGALAADDDGDRFVQLFTRGGELVAASPNVVAFRPPLEPTVEPGARTVTDFELEDDAYRVLVRQIHDEQVLFVGENIDDVNDAVRILRWTFLGALPPLVLLLAALTWWLVGRTLQPVENIRAEVAEIRAGALDRRVRVPATDDEIARLAGTMNEMLDRVEDASRRQDAFAADASHELRAPLTRMRTELEVELGRDDADLATIAASALDGVIELQALVQDLLHLARSDADGDSRQLIAMDLDDIVLREARHLREATTLRIDTSAVSAAHVMGDAAQLLRTVRNLTENAARHAATEIVLALHDHGGRVRLEVSDDGPGRSDDQLEAMFERFTRFDESRTADTGGTGLGLAIVRDIARGHGGDAWAEQRQPSGLSVIVELPNAEPSGRLRDR